MNPSNYTTISFPFLGLEWDPPRFFEIGPLTVRLYALCIVTGLVLACCMPAAAARSWG